MQNTKLIKVLKTFSKQEILRFKDFVNSPYFNKNRNVMKLCELVLSFYPEFEPIELTEVIIYRKVFGTGEFNYFRIKNIISDLYQLSVRFLKIKAFETDDYENEIKLLNELNERKLDLIYSQKEKKVSGYLNASMIKDESYYYLRHHLGKINTSHFKFEKTGYSFFQIQNEFDTFLEYTLIGLLRLYSKMLHNKNHGNIRFNMEMFDNVWDYIKDKDFEGNPSCQIYRQIISLELTREENEFEKLMVLKKKYEENIPEEDMYYILLIINSFSVYRLKLGDDRYYKHRFDSFRETIERNFIPHNNFLFINFISTFTSACMAVEYEWANCFINEFQKGISPKEERTNTINYCRGFIAYRQKDFDKALALFSKTNFKLYLMKVMVKSYTVRIFFEQNMPEQTISAIDAFRRYLKSEKQIAEDQKQAHYEFLKHLSDLNSIRLDNSPRRAVDLLILEDQIEKMSSNPIGTKNWLKEKAFELK